VKRLDLQLLSRLPAGAKRMNAAQELKTFPPSALLQGHGLMCLRLGARLVVHPAALPSPASPSSGLKPTKPRDATL
jgi:hypothetical protein